MQFVEAEEGMLHLNQASKNKTNKKIHRAVGHQLMGSDYRETETNSEESIKEISVSTMSFEAQLELYTVPYIRENLSRR